MDIQKESFNEFTNAKLAILVFLTLFPDGKGDPTNKAIVNEYHIATDSISKKAKHLVQLGELIINKWCYYFASHLQFRHWAYNILY